jgi:hypothetical protein
MHPKLQRLPSDKSQPAGKPVATCEPLVEQFAWEKRPLDHPQGVLARLRDALVRISFSCRDEMRIGDDWPVLSEKERARAIYRIVRYRLVDHGDVSFLSGHAMKGNLDYVAFELGQRFAALSAADPFRVEPLAGHYTNEYLDELGGGGYLEPARARLAKIQAVQLQKVRREAQLMLARYEFGPRWHAQLEGIALS